MASALAAWRQPRLLMYARSCPGLLASRPSAPPPRRPSSSPRLRAWLTQHASPPAHACSCMRRQACTAQISLRSHVHAWLLLRGPVVLSGAQRACRCRMTQHQHHNLRAHVLHTGGLGMAALQVARARGATVLATAGSRAKRAQLRSDHAITGLASSRSTVFVELAARHACAGRPATAALNSLTSPGKSRVRAHAYLWRGSEHCSHGARNP